MSARELLVIMKIFSNQYVLVLVKEKITISLIKYLLELTNLQLDGENCAIKKFLINEKKIS